MKRSSGILLHITSLPNLYGIGDLGPSARQWVDFLADTHCRLWQILPLNPTGYGDSPYQSFSAFAGNTNLISPDLLLQEGLIDPNDLADKPQFPESNVDYGAVIPWKSGLLRLAFEKFKKRQPREVDIELRAFQDKESWWLDDFSLFSTIKSAHGGEAWTEWQPGLRSHDQAALDAFRKEHRDEIELVIFEQFLFFKQWSALRSYTNSKGIKILGDIPLFVGMDSADAWGKQELFHFDEYGEPTVVAGAPPDYFSPTGQLWGNPLYRWDYHRQTGFKWWIDRIKANLRLYDVVRIDHFRGLAGYWEIPAESPTAEIGNWVRGPGKDLFESLLGELGTMPPLIAEDLGVITPDVVELQDTYSLPGMKIIQFAFSGADNSFLPHLYTQNCVVYTGTFDNDTCLGWFKTTSEQERDFCLRYLNSSGRDIAQDMIRCAWSSIANWALSPLQDFLNLDSSARMNLPGRVGGYWSWRFDAKQLTSELKDRIRELNYTYGRENAEAGPNG
ncbi:MAG TPA: 4-alpha-glucanotransferase [Anaerolineales bacterium]|nr:4-alpha-glucanotransferase [Anaerolineales bacterium]